MSEIAIIRGNKDLTKNYNVLKKGDIVVGILGYRGLTVGIRQKEEYKFLDLVERGIVLFPSALSQIASRSKAAQASLFNEYMLQHTFVARDRRDLAVHINVYNRHGIGRVVTKQNRLDSGIGIHLWSSIEQVYTHVSMQLTEYPFVVQPFVPNHKDVRVIVIGDYIEVYQRCNRYNFRQNLSFGGKAMPYTLSQVQIDLCKMVMERGKFPYAHIDLLITEDGRNYLSEISLHGNLHGARITREEYLKKIDSLTESFFKKQGAIKYPDYDELSKVCLAGVQEIREVRHAMTCHIVET